MSEGKGKDYWQPVRALVLVLGAFAWAAMIWVMSADYAERRFSAQRHAEEYARDAAEHIDRACAGLQSARLRECVTEQVKASRTNQRGEYDLSAQEDMADWAFWMFFVAFITMGLTALALWFVKGTLEATRTAVEETGEATDAMREANRIARNAATDAFHTARSQLLASRLSASQANKVATETRTAQLRAYVDVSKTQILYVETPPGQTAEFPGHHIIEISITNFGQTPAANVCVWADVILMSWPVTEVPKPTTVQNQGGTMPPGHPRRYRLGFKPAEYDQMLANTASFVIPVKVKYDILEGSNTDEFETCLVVTCDEARSGEARYLGLRDRVPREVKNPEAGGGEGERKK